MNSSKISCSILLLAASLSLTSLDATAQQLGPTLYGFGTGTPGPELIPRALEMDSPTLGTAPNMMLNHGNPGALALLCYGAAPRYAPLPVLGAELFLDPPMILATRLLTLDANGSAILPFGMIPNIRAFTGAIIYAQFLELSGASLVQSTAIAAQAATGCTVSAQATALVFGNPTGNALFTSISVPPPCTFQIIGQSVALPAAGVTIAGRRRVGPNVTVDFNHAGIPVGTQVSIMLEVWCTCNGVVSQHFLFARGTK